MSYSLKEAAEASGRTKPTILRAIKAHKISAQKDVHGQWQIDPAELHRVYPKTSEPERETVNDNNALEREVTLLREVIADLREDRDRWRAQAERLALSKPTSDVIVTPLSAAPAPVEAQAAPPARVSLPPAPVDAQVVPAADNQPQQYPARVVVKKAPKRTPKADAEVSWWRKMMGGR
ncbi:MAG: hypothetical protein JOZ58_19975 [Acetobacteraceae bacterium]|nr:hypothetical protein [Acetobacteraceae bacterium]MBV8577305.1 hypothetical protein [Acetobacteraceae bacterium]